MHVFQKLTKIQQHHLHAVSIIDWFPYLLRRNARPVDIAERLRLPLEETELLLYDLNLVGLVRWNDDDDLWLVDGLPLVGSVA